MLEETRTQRAWDEAEFKTNMSLNKAPEEAAKNKGIDTEMHIIVKVAASGIRPKDLYFSIRQEASYLWTILEQKLEE